MFLKGLMKLNKLLNKSYLSIVFWALILTVILFTMPDMGKLVRDKGQVTIGKEYSYSTAQNILNKLNDVKSSDKVLDVIMVYHSDKKLTDSALNEIKDKVTKLENNKNKYNVKTVLNVFTNKDIEDQVISKDKTTLLVPISIKQKGRTTETIRNEITKVMKTDKVTSYSTGSDFISEDFSKTIEAGVKKTELITIFLIIAILIAVFKSPVTPFATLATVGLSYLTSLGIVLQLVDKFNFSISNFTNVFLVLVLFGIGTDYTMLLLTRFKEELNNGLDTNSAIIVTYKTAGKTVILSSLTILIGFSCLMASQFKIYQSASAVAVGVAVLIIMIFTFLPALMKLFGIHLFWSPFKSSGHSSNKAWEKAATISTKYPFFALILVLAVCGLSYFYTSSLSFNNLKEIASNYPSVKGFNIVSKHFGVGKALPVNVAIENDYRLDNQYTLSEIDEITEAIKSVKGVKEVCSVTQPKGKKIKDLYIKDQANSLNGGLKDADGGVNKINNGLGDAVSKLQGAKVDTNSLDKLQKGANDLSSNMDLINKATNELKNGMNSGVQGSKDLSNGIQALDDSIGKLQDSTNDLQNAYTAIGKGYGQVGEGLNSLLPQVKNFQTAFGSVIYMQSQLAAKHPELNSDPTFVTMQQTSLKLNSKLQDMVDAITKLKAGLDEANSSLKKANNGLSQAQSGIGAMKSGSEALRSGSLTMANKLAEAADGQNKVANAMGQLDEGSKQLQDGQNQLINGISGISDKTKQLTDGLSTAQKGLTDISTGLNDANSYIDKLQKSKNSETFFIPQDKINNSDFSKSMDMYMSKDRKITEINVTLNIDPYSEDAMKITDKINSVVAAKIKTSTLKNSKLGISGISQMNNDLKTMSQKDFNKSSIIMICGILIVLLIVTRDSWMSIFIMASLVASYYIAISISGLLFNNVLGKGDLSWNVPFFSFIMIISLGVDYSIFLVMRYRENLDLPSKEAIVSAAKSVGGVISSAGIILSGTFAAMYPSGVPTLMELSLTVILGIILLCTVFLPIFIPAMIAIKSSILNKFEKEETSKELDIHSNRKVSNL
ncbi:MMPL family transporter [Clostridium acetobutylicum]|jgi:RND superfamily putative drug exporter|uniref:Membrane protein n=2 Tax=Clostridium acetobutylicum TaxID=1488 RepID=Q97TJ9_CLOAB|nr:Membrane protein [Clostridium acetobutylicum ATCC 824]AEI34843.1 hypothetical protein SMB_P100 [Clostridium acetobutylicum DSM 1731]AWV82389.1 MMPL family transporter [Clostridium acetobutylicum]PSM04425.1 MMPL family transporter [Clostridium sp. NJ4]MBC2395767.1 MMPL family transporter [Clostridium acetobutylicum]